MNEIVTDNINIENLIYEIRGKQVMLDSDLATLYDVEPKRINEAIRRNLEKFPERFSFILTKEEYINLKSQFATSSLNLHGGASLNFAGSKTFSINKLEDEMIIELLSNKINIINSKNTCI